MSSGLGSGKQPVSGLTVGKPVFREDAQDKLRQRYISGTSVLGTLDKQFHTGSGDIFVPQSYDLAASESTSIQQGYHRFMFEVGKFRDISLDLLG